MGDSTCSFRERAIKYLASENPIFRSKRRYVCLAVLPKRNSLADLSAVDRAKGLAVIRNDEAQPLEGFNRRHQQIRRGAENTVLWGWWRGERRRGRRQRCPGAGGQPQHRFHFATANLRGVVAGPQRLTQGIVAQRPRRSTGRSLDKELGGQLQPPSNVGRERRATSPSS